MKYKPQKIESKWQKYWESKKIYRAYDKSEKPKYYQLETFPYPSADGLHVGHPKGYVAEDIHARFMRMRGKEVLYTMGWDAFGLPTENYAIKVGKSPQEVASANIKNFKRQVKMFGLSYDWSREINTSDPEYYKWTQWLFIEFFKAGLAYQKLAMVNWCPRDQTVLANEQVIDGRCYRCESEVYQKKVKQWFFKITDYAESLLNDLKGLDWPYATVKRQQDWIGRSEGASIRFKLSGLSGKFVEVFTTRPDTLFGATFLVVSPELARQWIEEGILGSKEINNYVEVSLKKRELDRLEGVGEKTGIDSGLKAINPANKEEIPVWIADYVLGGYGTGAIMAVPAHDQRDYDFAKKFNLPIKIVICPHYPEKICPILDSAYEGEGHLVDSGQFNDMSSDKAKEQIINFVGGKKRLHYKLRDWSVSRQRYWGVPIPIIYCDKCGMVPVSENDLPVKLPKLNDYRPRGIPPLAGSEKFLKTKCPNCKGNARRDPETLDTFVDSSWYFLRYTDSKNKKTFADKDKLNYWMPVDLYIIGAEHTVLHLLYSRFVTKFLFDRGYLKYREPFLKLKHVGLILGTDGQKMSKSKGNVVNPDETVKRFGADATRMYEMFMGPFEDGQPWSTEGVVGVYRFLDRVWKFVYNTNFQNPKSKILNSKQTPNSKSQIQNDQSRLIHKTIKKITEDIENLRFNTAVSALMILLNEFENRAEVATKDDIKIFLKLLAPFAPHIVEELWQIANGHSQIRSIHLEKWPDYDTGLIKDETFKLIIQINGKMRDTVEATVGISENEAVLLASGREQIKKHLLGRAPKKTIFIPNRLLNFVV